MIWHSESLGEILVELESNADKGLNDTQVQERQVQYGANFIGAIQSAPFLARLKEAFTAPVSLTLLAAAVIAAAVQILSRAQDPLTVPILLVVLYAVQLLALTVRDALCIRKISDLRRRVSPSARVIRNGVESVVDATTLVPGDLVVLRKGDLIPADARLLASHRLTCDESLLSGHFVPVAKSADAVCEDITAMTERANTVHAGCVVTYGDGKAVVVATGRETEIGKLTVVEEEQELSVANRGLKALASQLKKYLPLLFVVVFLLYFVLLRFTGDGDEQHLLTLGATAFLYASTLLAALTPDGYPSMATLIFAIGVHRMSRRGAIMTNTAVIDKLGKVDVVCADKASMTVRELNVAKCYADGTVVPFAESPSDAVTRLLRDAALCADVGDDATDEALIDAYRSVSGLDKVELENLFPRLNAVPFDTKHGVTATVNMLDGMSYVIVKGAPETILEHCEASVREEGLAVFEGMGQEALHVIGVAVKPLNDPTLAASPTIDDVLCDLEFLGLIGFINLIRADAAEAVRFCQSTGTRPIMITGDGLATTVAVARQIGVLSDDSQAITGAELRAMDDLELTDKVDNYSVFARVTPEDKIRLVAALREKNHTVAITGRNPIDSVPLKAADVGLAMGMSGTDAARMASDVVLSDDNFSTIVAIINRCSTMYECIRKALQFYLCSSFALILLSLIGMAIWQKPVLSPVQMLAVGLLFSLLPPVAFGMEPIHKRKASAARLHIDSFFDGGRRLQVLWQGALLAVVTGIAFAIGGGALAYAVFVIAASLYSFCLRSRHPLRSLGFFGNPYMIIEIVLCIVICLLTLSAAQIGLGIGVGSHVFALLLLSVVPLIGTEAAKWIFKS